MALAALAGCYHAGALVVPSKPASVAAAAAATSPSPDLQIQRIFPASISKEISSPTSSVKLNGVLIASNAIGSASTNAAQAYWLAEMMSARFAEDPVWYKDDIEDVNVDVVATHTRLRIQNDRAASATHRNTAVIAEYCASDIAEYCASDIGFVNPTKIEANVKYARIVEHKQKHYAWLKLEVHSYRQCASPKRPLETAPRAEISCAAKAATASSEPRTPGSSKRGRIVTTALKPQPQPQACSSLRQLTSMSTDWQWRRFPHRRNRCCASAGRGTQSRSCTTYASCSPAKTNQARICS